MLVHSHNIQYFFKQALASGLPPLEANLLLMHASDLNRTQLITAQNFVFNLEQEKKFLELLQRRIIGEPIAYLLGRKEFFSLDFLVNSSSLIPRPETELLVTTAIEFANSSINNTSCIKILELGTGCGVIAITLAFYLQNAKIVATDISKKSLNLSKRNAERLLSPLHLKNIEFLLSDWRQIKNNLVTGSFDLIVSNPPYICVNDDCLRQGDLCFEPQLALTDGSVDGLDALRCIISYAKNHLIAGGALFIEHGSTQAAAVATLLRQAMFINIFCLQDLASLPRVSGGYKAA